MSKENQTENRDQNQSVGIGTENGRWITAKLTVEEISLLTGMKIALKEAGLAIPMTQLVRRILDIGLESLDKEVLKINPLSIFQVPTQGEAK